MVWLVSMESENLDNKFKCCERVLMIVREFVTHNISESEVFNLSFDCINNIETTTEAPSDIALIIAYLETSMCLIKSTTL